jgi:hypothetical protein
VIARALLAAAGLGLALACGVPGDGPTMRPGEDCLACHNGNQAGAWTVAGTVYSDPNAPQGDGEEGAQVTVTDANGRVLTITTNSAGNFYTAEALAAPFHVQVQRGSFKMVMRDAPTFGGCNSCHTQPRQADAPGRLFVPYQALSSRTVKAR